MNCDLLINENSCRFCLGDAEDGVEMFSDRKIYFCVQKRLIDCSEIFKFLEIEVNIDNQAPNMPNRICNQCKTTTCEFYILRKNFQENEAVLSEKSTFIESSCSDEVRKVKKVFNEFMREHNGEHLKAIKYSDRLEIRRESAIDDYHQQPDVKVPISEKPEMYACQKCSSLFSEHQHCVNHERKCVYNEEIQLDDLICTVSNQSEDYFCENESQVMECSAMDQNEEHLEDDGEPETHSGYEDEIETFDSELKVDRKPYLCAYCEKSFISRSGRDTHQQLKHKIPIEFHDECPSVRSHELEIVLANGQHIRAWKCPTCDLVSKRKNHHEVHLARHAIRKKDEMTKLEDQKSNPFIQTSEPLHQERVNESSEIDDEPVTDVHEPSSVSANSSKVPKIVYDLAACNEFCCSECGSKFKDEESAKVHVQKLGTSGLCTRLVCTECKVVFSSDNSFHRHQSHHLLAAIIDSLEFFECSTCSVIFGSQKDFDKHNLLHSNYSYVYEPETTTKLEGCEAIVYDLNLRWDRIDLHCAYCTKFGSKREMNLHMALFHGNLVCPIDRQDFSRGLSYFVEHMKIKHPELFGEVALTFTCPHCKTAEFQKKELMVKHSQTCQAKSFSCSHCTKKFALERQLKLHLASVSGNKQHKCSDCGKGFTSKTELNVHTRSHTRDKPYMCTFPSCSKSFRTNSHRSSHMYTHNPDKKFQCRTCSAMFQTPGAKRIHEKSHAAKIFCEICMKEFGQRSHYVRHINDQHRIKCNSANLEECVNNFNQRSLVNS